jgi:hypothetical protein
MLVNSSSFDLRNNSAPYSALAMYSMVSEKDSGIQRLQLLSIARSRVIELKVSRIKDYYKCEFVRGVFELKDSTASNSLELFVTFSF